VNAPHRPEDAPAAAQSARELRVIALSRVPLVRAGDDLTRIVLDGVRASNQALQSGDVLVVAQKIVSKAQGRMVDLRSVTPSPRALEMAQVVAKDPRLIELILSESTEVLRVRKDVIVVVHRLGFVMANAGIDLSNVGAHAQDGKALLLPLDPDATCEQIRRELLAQTGVGVGVVINDSHGRAWRNGTVGVAIGASGVPALLDLRGEPDLFGRALRITEVGLADEMAAAASLMMGQSHEGAPIVLLRGVPYTRRDGDAKELIRAKQLDLFR
jgi:coenzyme F420-0:L-glutamate ligase / coenzyme F420-1:gamma-L-glutamate ligase